MRAPTLHRTEVMARHNLTLQLRDPAQLISYVLIPMVLMVLLRPLYDAVGGVDGTQAALGPLVMFSVYAMVIVGNSILVERHWRTWEQLHTTQARRIEVLVAKAVPVYLLVILQQLVLIGYGCLVAGLEFPPNIGYVVAAVAIWAFTLLAIGTALGTVLPDFPQLAMVGDLSAIGFGALGGALAPVDLMPGWVQAIAPFTPVYWALSLLRAAVVGDLAGAVVPALVCLAIGLAAGCVAVYRVSRGRLGPRA
ncbi:ABC transporter permease [Pseudonocardia endophytica]|uniref:ABC-2 type transport system permease protein n=1 Tax=Pseudonocardia endophytica TaxID=401976 RepID=A0A4R1HJ07_PSEEN|nr:ABC transporter permease [Pseudonocardia endophytica]TCK22294.1 ABC-2 type transport system permease protein [Pseudonocardia endophytica]